MTNFNITFLILNYNQVFFANCDEQYFFSRIVKVFGPHKYFELMKVPTLKKWYSLIAFL